jgi:Actin like proteins N terminal domain
MLMKAKLAKVSAAVDLGASLTRAFWSYLIEESSDYREGFKTAFSIVRQLTKAKYESMLDLADDNSSLVKFEDTYWLVGDAARGETLSLLATQPKRETAIAKALAIVGQLVDELKGQGVGEIQLTFGLLLPLDELKGDRQELEQRLAKALLEFEHNGVTVSIALSRRVDISPEGYGISQTIQVETGKVLIFGHRDVTAAHVERGSIVPDKSKTFAGCGMHRLINEVEFTFKDEFDAAAAIFAAETTGKDKHLLKIASEADLPRLKSAIAKAKEQLWLDLSVKLRLSLAGDIQQVACSGGNAHFWRPQLKELLGSKGSYCGPLIQELKGRFPDLAGSPLLGRSADNYRFWLTLPGVPEFSALEVQYAG